MESEHFPKNKISKYFVHDSTEWIDKGLALASLDLSTV